MSLKSGIKLKPKHVVVFIGILSAIMVWYYRMTPVEVTLQDFSWQMVANEQWWESYSYFNPATKTSATTVGWRYKFSFSTQGRDKSPYFWQSPVPFDPAQKRLVIGDEYYWVNALDVSGKLFIARVSKEQWYALHDLTNFIFDVDIRGNVRSVRLPGTQPSNAYDYWLLIAIVSLALAGAFHIPRNRIIYDVNGEWEYVVGEVQPRGNTFFVKGIPYTMPKLIQTWTTRGIGYSPYYAQVSASPGNELNIVGCKHWLTGKTHDRGKTLRFRVNDEQWQFIQSQSQVTLTTDLFGNVLNIK